MIIVGSEGKIIDLGVAEHKYCPVCERERPFHIYLQYVFNHFWYIFGYTTGKKYHLSCEICSRGAELNKNEAEHHLVKSPIPLMHRYGCLVGIAGFFVFMMIFAAIVEIFDL